MAGTPNPGAIDNRQRGGDVRGDARGGKRWVDRVEEQEMRKVATSLFAASLAMSGQMPRVIPITGPGRKSIKRSSGRWTGAQLRIARAENGVGRPPKGKRA